MSLDELIRHAIDGNAILFVGSGFSHSARNLNDEKLKTGNQLAKHLMKECGINEEASLEDASEFYIKKHGPTKLVNLLVQEFKVSHIEPEQEEFGKIKWKRIYTTNYDDVIESAYKSNNKSIVPLTLSDRLNRISESSSKCIHINGYINKLDKDNLSSDFKLTDTSYASTRFSDSEWAGQFRNDISSSKAIFFVGYSGYDLDIKQILLSEPNIIKKTVFIVGKNPNEILQHKLSKYGSVLNEDAISLSRRLRLISQTHTPRKHTNIIGQYVKSMNAPDRIDAPRDKHIHDLFLFGTVKPELIWNSTSQSGKDLYIKTRDDVYKCIQMLEDGEKNVVIQSNLGNGKTMFMQSLGVYAKQFNYDVYYIENTGEGSISEIEVVSRCSKKTILLIDGYTNKRDIIKVISVNRSDNLHLVLSARTLKHDVSFEWLYNTLGVNQIPEIPLDNLKNSEVKWFSDTMEEYGLWRHHSSKSPTSKFNLLKDRGQISSILLEILESPAIAEKLVTIIREISGHNEEYLEATASILTLSVVGIGTQLRMLTDLIGTKVLNQADFRNNESIRELLDFYGGEIKAKNAVVSHYLLTKAIKPIVVVDALIAMTKRANTLRHNVIYYEIAKELMRFVNVQAVLPYKGKMDAVLRYYEHVKHLELCHRNPNFWLQYALATLALKNFSDARIKIDTAYAHAQAKERYNTFMIDTTSARLELEDGIHYPKKDRDTAISAFRKAKRLIQPLIDKNENQHYPYRVATLFKEYLETHKDLFQPKDIEEVVGNAKFVRQRIEKLPAGYANKHYVEECRKAMDNIIEEYGSTNN